MSGILNLTVELRWLHDGCDASDSQR